MRKQSQPLLFAKHFETSLFVDWMNLTQRQPDKSAQTLNFLTYFLCKSVNAESPISWDKTWSQPRFAFVTDATKVHFSAWRSRLRPVLCLQTTLGLCPPVSQLAGGKLSVYRQAAAAAQGGKVWLLTATTKPPGHLETLSQRQYVHYWSKSNNFTTTKSVSLCKN